MGIKKKQPKIMTRIRDFKENQITVCQFRALKEAFLYLSKNHISCFFYQRIDKLQDFEYSEGVCHRMKMRLNFSKMYQDPDAYESELKELLGEKYSRKYVSDLAEIPQIIIKGNRYRHEDKKSALVNVIGGRRVTTDSPKNFTRTIHIYGRCGVFGYAVEDSENMPSQLQKLLNLNGYEDIRVINHGLWGGTDKDILHNFINDVYHMKSGDIVVFYQRRYPKMIMDRYMQCGLWYRDLTNEYHQYPEARWCFYDKPGHMNRDGYRIIAKLVFDDLNARHFSVKEIGGKRKSKNATAHIDKYLKVQLNEELQTELNDYLKDIQSKYPQNQDIRKCGAIVMNCNPFTKGHQYLIDYASKQVDRLYIFVVEEDRSFFSFADRYEMVKKGTEEHENVVVVPSGKFMISALTFPEYFLKDFVKEKNFDVSMDLEIFGEKIAPALHISVRFAGEEPFDPVTATYNENMKKILPDYGIEFCEIPRLKISEDIVNATLVRQLMKDGEWHEVEHYVPQTTYKIIMERYREV